MLGWFSLSDKHLLSIQIPDGLIPLNLNEPFQTNESGMAFYFLKVRNWLATFDLCDGEA